MRNWTKNAGRAALVAAGIAMAGAGLGSGTAVAGSLGSGAATAQRPAGGAAPRPLGNAAPTNAVDDLAGSMGLPGSNDLLVQDGRITKLPAAKLAGTKIPAAKIPVGKNPVDKLRSLKLRAVKLPGVSPQSSGAIYQGAAYSGASYSGAAYPGAAHPGGRRARNVPSPDQALRQVTGALGRPGAQGLPDASGLPGAQGLTHSITRGLAAADGLVPGAVGPVPSGPSKVQPLTLRKRTAGGDPLEEIAEDGNNGTARVAPKDIGDVPGDVSDGTQAGAADPASALIAFLKSLGVPVASTSPAPVPAPSSTTTPGRPGSGQQSLQFPPSNGEDSSFPIDGLPVNVGRGTPVTR